MTVLRLVSVEIVLGHFVSKHFWSVSWLSDISVIIIDGYAAIWCKASYRSTIANDGS